MNLTLNHYFQQEKPSLSSPLNISQLQEEEKCVEEAPRWSGSTPSSGTSDPSISNNQVANSPRQEPESYKKEDQENGQIEESPQPSQQYVERTEVKQPKMSFKQPLPGFHQAFGSTEIGRFSRSEFFANMVGENSNVSVNISNDRSCGDDEGVDLASRLSTIDDLRHGGDIPEVSSNCPNPNSINNCGNSANNFGNLTLASYYNEARSPAAVAPCWHSPCVSAIGSEI